MKNWSRLILPLGLAILATIMNAGAMTNRLAVVKLVAVGRQIKQGERFKESDFVKVEVSYPASHLKNHFWLWEERDVLLHGIGTPSQLEAGDLVPRSQYRSCGTSVASIPEGSVMIGIRFPESVMKAEERHLLLPGRDVKLTFREGGEVRAARIAFLEPCIEPESSKDLQKYYQMGVLLDEEKKEDIRRISSSTVNAVVGLSGSDSSR